MNVILVLFLTLLPGVKPSSPEPQDCSALEITYTTQVIADQITINVQASRGTQPYFYFFFDSNNNPLTWDFKKNDFTADRNKSPKYIKVFDSKGCSKKIEFNESTIK
ncbi:MAG TPA: hypothetical protein VK666_21610 [Chryseolinea sp.]|nr:hypothetical protein [Chryseolinea sp.]